MEDAAGVCLLIAQALARKDGEGGQKLIRGEWGRADPVCVETEEPTVFPLALHY